jgi:hypothetical protein
MGRSGSALALFEFGFDALQLSDQGGGDRFERRSPFATRVTAGRLDASCARRARKSLCSTEFASGCAPGSS